MNSMQRWSLVSVAVVAMAGSVASAQDACSSAVPLVVPSTNAGTTVGATVDVAPACGDASIPSAAGVWYSVIGTGNLMTASLCDGGTPYDSQLSVFTDGCGTLTCVAGNDDSCGVQSEASWCSTLGVEYLILVHGSGVEEGGFSLELSDDDCDDGDACTADSCSAAACDNTDTTPAGDCCDPVTGDLTTIDDSDACTIDTCNPDGSVTHTDTTPGGQCCNPADGTLTPIDDSDLCTADTCNPDGSVTHADTTPAGQCCAPLTGNLTPIDDGNVCTDDTCNPNGTVSHVFNTDPCDDGDACTAGDVCSGGVCSGTLDPACTPSLDLVFDPSTLPNTSCFGVGDIITVRIEMGPSLPFIVGGQFFLEYDTATLDLIDIVPGDPPFTLPIFNSVDEVNGTIDYAVGVPSGDPGTDQASTLAIMTFEATSECDTSVQFRPHDPPTLLTDADGIARDPILGGSSPSAVNATAPLLNCPGDITVNADAGSITAAVSWAPVTAADSCDGALPVTCTSLPTAGLGEGGVFPPGVTTVSCEATNSCGITGNCSFDVEVTPFNEVLVDIELSPTIVAGPLTRCITFDLHRCGVTTETVSQEIDFGGLFAPPGMAVNVSVLAPAGAWECITARDELHTLRSTANDFSDNGTTFSASFLGDPAQGGHWLVGGNLNDTEFIDILDFAIYNAQFGVSFADTDCSVAPEHADINGDGLVTVFDFTFIQQNFLGQSQSNCCGLPGPAHAEGPITEISVRELHSLGLGHLSGADLNDDGLVNVEDVQLFLEQPPQVDRGSALRDGSRAR